MSSRRRVGLWPRPAQRALPVKRYNWFKLNTWIYFCNKTLSGQICCLVLYFGPCQVLKFNSSHSNFHATFPQVDNSVPPWKLSLFQGWPLLETLTELQWFQRYQGSQVVGKVVDGPWVGSRLGIDSLSWKLLFLNIYRQGKIGFRTFWATTPSRGLTIPWQAQGPTPGASQWHVHKSVVATYQIQGTTSSTPSWRHLISLYKSLHSA